MCIIKCKVDKRGEAMVTILLTILILTILISLAKLLYLFIKKEKITAKGFIILACDSLISLIIALIINLICKALLNPMDIGSLIKFSLVFYGLIIFVSPSKICLAIKNKSYQLNTKKLTVQIGTLAIILLELFAFNANAYKDDYEYYQITDLTTLQTTGTILDDGSIYLPDESYIVINKVDIATKNIYFDFNDVNLDSYIKISYKYTNSTSFNFYKEYQTNPQYDRFNVLSLSGLNYDVLKIEFAQDDTHNIDGKLYLKSISFNQPMNVVFHLSRFIVLTILLISLTYISVFVNKIKFKEENKLTYLKRGILISFGVILLAFIIIAFINKDTFFLSYPFNGDLEDYDIYMQTFDAFKKGQLFIDIKPDPRLVMLENPYDRGVRGGIPCLWDHAYYNGKYYCYYGIAPLILITFPLYFLSNLVTNVLFLQIFGTICFICVMLLTIIEAVTLFAKKVNLPILLFVLVSSIFLSLSLCNITLKIGTWFEGIYHVPIVFGNVFSMLFVLLTLKGYKDEKHRPIYLAFAGLSFVLLMASRPNLFMFLIFMLPFFITMLFKKNYPFKKKIKDLLPMCSVLLVGAITICIYNYVRFDSIFEFGQFYQLTVTDNTKLSLGLYDIFPAFYHFFIQIFGVDSKFPYIYPAVFPLPQEYHVYVQSSMGILTVPFMLFILAIPLSLKKDDSKVLKWSLYLMPLTILCLAIITYAYAGVCPRYLLDLFPLATLTACIVFFKLLDKYAANKQFLEFFIPISFCILFFSNFMTFNVIFCRFDGLLSGDLNGLLIQMREFFGSYNTY